jgi:hypothetical protein
MSDGNDLVLGTINDELSETVLRKDAGGPGEGAAGLRVVNLQDGSPAILGDSRNDPGVAGYSTHYIGMTGDGPYAGVFGESATGPGVAGSGDPGVTGSGSTGVGGYGSSNGVFGAGGTNGVFAYAAHGTGLVAAGATAAKFFGPVEAFGDLDVSGNLTVSGFKAAAVAHPDGTRRLLYAIESPQSWFEDFGEAQLTAGRAAVTLDPEFASVIDADSYQVFLTSYGPTLIYVSDRTPTGFDVSAIAPSDQSTHRFGYRVIGRRRDAPGMRLERTEARLRDQPEIPAPPVLPERRDRAAGEAS